MIDNARALTDQPLTHAMQSLQVELIGSLRGDKLHLRPLHGFGNRLRVTEVVLLAFGIGAHVPRRHQPRIVPQRVKLAAEMMSTDAGLHADQARRHVGKPRDHFCRRTIAPRSSSPTMWNEFFPISMPITEIAVDAVAGIACSSFFAPLASLSPAGQEHGRTIPLADLRLTRPPHFSTASTRYCGGKDGAARRSITKSRLPSRW